MIENTTGAQRMTARIWCEGVTDHEGDGCLVELERAEVNEIALHVLAGEDGATLSLYFDREESIAMARKFLEAAAL